MRRPTPGARAWAPETLGPLSSCAGLGREGGEEVALAKLFGEAEVEQVFGAGGAGGGVLLGVEEGLKRGRIGVGVDGVEGPVVVERGAEHVAIVAEGVLHQHG